MGKTVTLQPTGQQMPLTGFGLWKVARPTCADTVYHAIQQGYRLLDGAGDYGNEKEAGEGLNRAIKDGLVKREDVFVTSKLWNTFHDPQHVEKLARHQLALWGIEYFDLFLIHFPVSLKYVDINHRYPPEWWADDGKTVETENIPLQATWQAMETLVEKGLVKNIGISNYSGSLIIDLFRYARIKPSVLQIEHHPYLVQQPLLDLAKHFGLAVTAYSSFGPQSFVELNMDRGTASLLDGHEVVGTIAASKKKTPAQVLLRWATQRGLAVIPKSNSADRVAANFQSEDFDLTEDEIKKISALDKGVRFNDPADINVRLSIFA